MVEVTDRPRRLLYIVNHRTLMPAEVPMLMELGWEVFCPKIVPSHDPGFRSALVTREYDSSLTIPKEALDVLNSQDFYERSWSSTVRHVAGRYFDVIINHFSYYSVPVSEAARHFPGLVVLRTFGREHPSRYAEFAEIGPRKSVLDELDALGSRLVHAQGYANIADIEPPVLQRTAMTVTVPLPPYIYASANTWRGGGKEAVLLCPAIMAAGGQSYYGNIYRGIKRDFGDLPHVIFGRQPEPVNDPAVLPYLTDPELLDLYARAPVFIYPSAEPRHIHYSPIEAMVVGTPVLYRRGSLTDTLAEGADLPGACADTAEMRDKAQRLLAGDSNLAEAIRATQGRIVDTFSSDLARRQWEAVLGRAP
ncbi:glycosyltransferase [Roseomonas sp. SSH11]|uniref:Glycosyltransferase n=1 Tax=Pararoseomonas baculiformis TaxID=2820812 RepID=A0ABS4AJ07_9PROT|nr:glycosyltransferase [Pararoseomonas baculiformis]MBP0447017.1 glycosyltransferase [Pararoseomonas baculiformis]